MAHDNACLTRNPNDLTKADSGKAGERNSLPTLDSGTRVTQQDETPTMSALTMHILIAGTALLWMSVSSGLILLNKHILKDLNFHFPMAVTGLGMLFSSVAAFITIHVLKLVPAKQTVTRQMWIKQIVPVGLCMALSLQLGNYAYLELTVAFIQMLKALCPVMTLAALAMARMLNPSKQLIASVLIISLGVVISSYGEVNFSWLGVGAMIGSEGAEASRLVITQLLLVGLKFHPFEGLLYMAPACCLWLATGCAIFELPVILREGSIQIVKDHPILFICAGLMGFIVNVLSFWVIRLASSLTLKVLATVKNTLLVAIGALFLSEIVTPLQSVGYTITMVGFVWYQSVYVPPAATAQLQRNKQGYEPITANDDFQADLPIKKFTPLKSELTENDTPGVSRSSSVSSIGTSIGSGRRRTGADNV